MSLSNLLGVARSALHYQQTVIETAGHNIANAETEGYTRQRVDARAAVSQRLPYAAVGAGVAIDDVRRARDGMLDQSYRREASGHGAASLRHELLASVESVLGEPSDDGLAATMDALWSSWSELASQPTSQAARSVVQQRARAVAAQLNTLDRNLADVREQATARLDGALAEVNGLASEIAELNGRIVSAAVGGRSPNDLLDQRDLAIDKLARLGDLRVLPQRDGSVAVVLGNNTVVDGLHAQRMQRAAGADGTLRLAFASNPAEPLLPSGGSLQTLLDFQNAELPETQERLDALANTLARAVNAIHARGNDGTAGAPYDPVFVDRESDSYADGDPFQTPPAAGVVTARNIGLASAIERDASRLASTSSLATRPADNDVALAIAGLRTATAATLGGVALATVDFTLPDRTVNPPGRTTTAPTSLANFYRTTNSGLAARVKDAEGAAAVRRALFDQAEARRASVGGVNVDEELTTLMRAQQAYAAAAKVITAADEMMQTLIGMV
jgi:flagellar hook-associated protein 1 FlgK